MKLNLFILFSLTLFCLSPPALSELNFPEMPSKKKPLSISLQTEFYRSVSNFTNLGQYEDLPSENYFQHFGFHPTIRYSPFSSYINFQFFAKNFYAESKTLNTKRNVFRTSHIGGGVSLYHRFKTFYSGFELRGGMPLYDNFKSPNEMIVGDGAYFVEPGLWFLLKPAHKFYIYYNVAFRYRMFSLSSLLFNRLGGSLRTKYTDLGVSMDSFVSLLSDDFASHPEKRWNHVKKVNGGSYKFFSVNPSVLSLTAWMEFKFKPIFAKVYFNTDMLGKYYARGLSFGLITTIKWSTKSSIIKKKRKNLSFDLDEDLEDSSSTRSHKRKSYFEEEEDPYSKENINKELKKELKSLRY